MICEKHKTMLIARKTPFKTEEFYCEVCDLEKLENYEAEQERKKQKELIETYKRRRIEPLYYDKNLKNFIADTDELLQAKLTIENLITTKKGKVIFIGKNGTGKTHLGIAAIKEIPGVIYTMFEISSLIRQSYKDNGKSELQILDELSTVKLLVIDEVGRTKGSDAEHNWLSYIVDKRHVRGLPIVIISNNHLKKNCPAKGCEKCLEHYLSTDIVSRLTENGTLLEFTGKDYRRK